MSLILLECFSAAAEPSDAPDFDITVVFIEALVILAQAETPSELATAKPTAPLDMEPATVLTFGERE
jgi:hypothetical protein